MILGIDPGTAQSAYVLYEFDTPRIVSMDILHNDNFYDKMKEICKYYRDCFIACIEDVGCYGMPVGREVFEMVRFSGRLQQLFMDSKIPCHFIPRREIKLHFCNSMKAKDGNIRQALIDKFGKPGTKNDPGFLYGIRKDIWSALAIAVYGIIKV